MDKFSIQKARNGLWILWYPHNEDYGYFPSWAAAMAAVDKIIFQQQLRDRFYR